MKTVTLAEARQSFRALISEVESFDEHVMITKNGKPTAVIISADEWEAIEDTAFWLKVPVSGMILPKLVQPPVSPWTNSLPSEALELSRETLKPIRTRTQGTRSLARFGRKSFEWNSVLSCSSAARPEDRLIGFQPRLLQSSVSGRAPWLRILIESASLYATNLRGSSGQESVHIESSTKSVTSFLLLP